MYASVVQRATGARPMIRFMPFYDFLGRNTPYRRTVARTVTRRDKICSAENGRARQDVSRLLTVLPTRNNPA